MKFTYSYNVREFLKGSSHILTWYHLLYCSGKLSS